MLYSMYRGATLLACYRVYVRGAVVPLCSNEILLDGPMVVFRGLVPCVVLFVSLSRHRTGVGGNGGTPLLPS